MRVLLLLVSCLLLSAGAQAQACVPTTSDPEYCWENTVAATLILPCDSIVWTLKDPDGYVDHDNCDPSVCIFSIWIYAESNGIHWLQRGDVIVDDTCGGQIESDTIIF